MFGGFSFFGIRQETIFPSWRQQHIFGCLLKVTLFIKLFTCFMDEQRIFCCRAYSTM